jgi:polyhydroxybutyrate depolymerase
VESSPVKRDRRALVIALGIISLPVLLASVNAMRFDVVNRSNGSIISAGVKRDYVLYVPPSYQQGKPAPLVISLHGAGLWGAGQQTISQWNGIADREGFIVVYPSGFKDGGPRIWHVEPSPRLAQDIRFIAELIDTLAAHYTIDRSRIYANGLSNGGGMSFVLSCTLSDRIAAVGLVAAAQTLPWQWCSDRRPVPMIAFHGTADMQVPYKGGSSWVSARAFPDVKTWAANWARRNRCALIPADSVVAADVRRTEYTGCADDAAVVLYTILGGGHTWPGGKALPEWFVGRTSNSVDATSVMWQFFQQHPLGSNLNGAGS